MKAMMNTDMFLMRTKGCEVTIEDNLGGNGFVTATITVQPNRHRKAPKVGTSLKVSTLDIDFI